MKKREIKDEKSQLENEFSFSLPGLISTDIDILDFALGGGLPLGRQIDINALWGVGKSSFSLYAGSRYLKHYPGKVYYFESEGKPHIADHVLKAFGYQDLTKIVTRRPKNILELLDQLEELMMEIDTGCIIVDSITAFGVDRGKEGTKDYIRISDSPQIAQVAAKNDQFMRGPFFKSLTNKQIMFLVVNQLRDNLGDRFGGKHIPGGNALRFASSLNIRMSREQGWKIEDNNKNIIGQNVTFYIEKSVIGPPFREVSVPFYWDNGWDGTEALLMSAYERGVIKAGGGWFEIRDKKLRKHEAVNFLNSDHEFYQETLEKTLSLLG